MIDLNNILLLTTRSHLSIAQASSSFKRFNTHTLTYITLTFITEALRLLTQVQLLLIDFTVNKRLIQHWLTLIGLVSMTRINTKATPINNTDYNCHITAVELV